MASPSLTGQVDDSFQTDAIAVSLDGEYFRQDKLTVLAGKLPALDSTNEIAVTQLMAQKFGLHPGSHLTWQFQQYEVNAQGLPLPGPAGEGIARTAQTTTFVVTGIAAMPPALGDTFDDVAGAHPAAGSCASVPRQRRQPVG